MMFSKWSLTEVELKVFLTESFKERHIGPRGKGLEDMLAALGVSDLEELTEKVVPKSIRKKVDYSLPEALSESDAIAELGTVAKKNKLCRSFIGLGYSETVTPSVIKRTILENPGWYTQYTPYQAEIAQGRLEALLNFQTLVSDLTGLPIANASLLDEGTAAAEAMMLSFRVKGSETKNKYFIATDCFPQTKQVLATRAEPLGIEIVEADQKDIALTEEFFGACIQYPNQYGATYDFSEFAKSVHEVGAVLSVAADLLALVLLKSPGSLGADIVVGNSQRFGVPLMFGGPHAAFFACKDEFKRQIPGRLVGVSKDADGKNAYRLALQAREQHIRRDRATSNICTAQVLLAVIAGMYAVYHGPKGLKRIAERVHSLTKLLHLGLQKHGVKVSEQAFFDTLYIPADAVYLDQVRERAAFAKVNIREFEDGAVGVSLDEATTEEDVQSLISILSGVKKSALINESIAREAIELPVLDASLLRSDEILTHPVFHKHASETEFLRYVKRLESRDLSLTTSMIALGSCTMKLNAASEMYPVSWPEFASIHPFAPIDQVDGYLEMFRQLEDWLADITGFAAVSLQPNAGSQGEYAGLLAIREYHLARGDKQRNVCLIPTSAHGTNPASAVMAGMEVVAVNCDDQGNIDLNDLKQKAEKHQETLSSLMVTYPSTHGVFEEHIQEVCQVVHDAGGQVYLDGANLNAQVCVCRPGDYGADVCHLNLHKTFCIPHGGGGPGVGPIGVAAHLKDFLPGHWYHNAGLEKSIGPVSAAPWGSAGVLPIPWMYIRMMGEQGLYEATQVAILNANYIAKRLEPFYPVLYRGKNGFVAHECILDLRSLKKTAGIEVEDIAKRLIDYGYHAPTVSWPVIGTMMVEPTESESKAELDRFCDAMIAIWHEVEAIEKGEMDKENNPLKNAPHTAERVASDSWDYPYSREQAAYPIAQLREHKFWPYVRRIDNAYGDRNLFCSCPTIE